MQLDPSVDAAALRKSSWLFWCVLFIPLAIIGLGINFITDPAGASARFGIPIHDPASFPFMWTKGIRDIFSGAVVLTFLLKEARRATAIVFTIAIFIPVCDGLIILSRWVLRRRFTSTGGLLCT